MGFTGAESDSRLGLENGDQDPDMAIQWMERKNNSRSQRIIVYLVLLHTYLSLSHYNLVRLG